MKNFFKKLSFVLAIAMVLTAIAPANASAAENFIYKSGNFSELADGFQIWVGDDATDLNVVINGKKNVAGNWKVGNTDVATIDADGKLTAVANGNTTVRFTAETGETDTVKVIVGTRVKTVKPYDPADTEKAKLETLTLAVGDEKEVYVGLGISKKAAAAGGEKTTMKTYFTVEGEAVEVEKTSNQKYVVKAVKAGEATVTIGAHKTLELAKAGKFFKKATIAVTVAEELNASQTGVKDITVTGSNLTDKVADYVVKKGNASIVPAGVKLVEGKAVITMPTNLGKNTYTVSFQGSEAIEVKTVAGVIEEIVFTSETAIAQTMANNAVSSASVTYKVLNQFGEDITKTTSIDTNVGSDLMVTGGPGTITANNNVYGQGVITISGIPAASGILNVSTLTLNIISTGNGKNVSKTFTLSSARNLASIELLGVYKETPAGLVPAELVAGQAATGLYLLIDAKDQYGAPVVNGSADTLNLPYNGFFEVGAPVEGGKKLNNVTYMAYAIASVGTIPGTPNQVAVCLTNGATASLSVTISAPVVIAKFSATPVNGNVLYAGVKTEFDYTVVDSEGNDVTKFSVLNPALKAGEGKQMPAGFTWERQKDGSAKLFYTPAAVGTSATNLKELRAENLSFWSQTMVYANTMVTVYEAPVARAIIGLRNDALKTTYTAAIGGDSITLDGSNFIYADQYDNPMPVSATAETVVAYTAVTETTAFNAVVAGDTEVDPFTVATKAGKSGNVVVTFSLPGVDNSEFPVTLKSATIDEVTGFTATAYPYGKTLYDATAGATAEVNVTGKVGSNNVRLTAVRDFAVATNNNATGSAIVIPATGAFSPVNMKEGTVEAKVQIFNTAADEITATAAYSNAPSDLAYVAPVTGIATVVVNTTTAAGIVVEDMLTGVLYGADQYSAGYTMADFVGKVRVNVSLVDADVDGNGKNVTVVVGKNNSTLTTVAVAGAANDKFILHVEYVFANGKTTEADVCFKIQ